MVSFSKNNDYHPLCVFSPIHAGLTAGTGYFTTLTGTTSYSNLLLTSGLTAGTGYFTTLTGTTSYSNLKLTSGLTAGTGYFTTLTGTTSYSNLLLTSGLTAGTGYFTTFTGTNSYVGAITGNTGYFTSVSGATGWFNALTAQSVLTGYLGYFYNNLTCNANMKILFVIVQLFLLIFLLSLPSLRQIQFQI